MRNWLNTNQFVGIFLSLIFLALLIYVQFSSWADQKLRDGFLLGFFPKISLILSLSFSLILIFDKRRKEILSGLTIFNIKTAFNVLLILLILWAYSELMRKFGFLVISPIFLGFGMFFLGLKSLKRLFLSILIIVLIVFIIFSLIGIELPPINFVV